MTRPAATPGQDFPWWLVACGAMFAAAFAGIWASPLYAAILAAVWKGLGITVFVSVAAFALATGLGLVLALGLMAPHVAIRQTARFVIEVVRGIPIIVLLLYVAFVGGPALVALWNWCGGLFGAEPIRPRDLSLMWRAIIALMIGYAPYIAEVFRAGFEAVDKGQIEAAKALGLRPGQRFRLIVLPQAVKIMAPPLGNFFIALIKDSALVSVLGVADITQLGKLYASGSFRYLETYNVVTLVYLVLTIGLSLLLRALERRLNRAGAHPGEP